MKVEEAKRLGQEMDSLVQIGKKGITEGMIEEVNRHFEDRDLVKIRSLRNNPVQSVDEVASKLEDKTDGTVVETRGNTILMICED